jgi:phage-related baseplate assembly protein
MSSYGVTPLGFVVKPFTVIMDEKLELARSLFGAEIDLHSSSALRKIIDIVSAEDHELWKALEANYYANFVSTASGDALDLLGDDLGLQREQQHAVGSVTFTLAGEAPNRTYVVPSGTLVETAAPVVRFRTTEAVTLSGNQKSASAAARGVLPGISGNVPKDAISVINPGYVQHFLSLGSATIKVTNPSKFSGGEAFADDETYRQRLLQMPRTLFTVQAVKAAVLQVDGVRDCRLNDPLGGVDVSRSFFSSFVFDRRRFGQARQLGSPYFFDIYVAPKQGYTWETLGDVIGLRDAVSAAVDNVRPIGIFPNIRPADSVVVGVRANVLTRPGMEAAAVDTALKSVFERRVTSLGLGRGVLAAEVTRDFMNVSGVVDVQNLHLRRYPPTFGSIGFGDREQFESAVIEAAPGANLPLSLIEIATFRYDSQLIDLRVSDR